MAIIYVEVQTQTMLCRLCVQLYFGENERFAIYYHACAIRESLRIDVYGLGRLCCVSAHQNKSSHKQMMKIQKKNEKKMRKNTFVSNGVFILCGLAGRAVGESPRNKYPKISEYF